MVRHFLFYESHCQLLESGWVIYGPEYGYNFPYPHLLRVDVNILSDFSLYVDNEISIDMFVFFLIFCVNVVYTL